MIRATRRQATRIFGITTLFALGIVGCQSDDPTGLDQVADEPGQVIISASPGEIEAPWYLVRPDKVVLQGTGSEEFGGMETGLYTLVWAPVPGWYSPTPNPVQASF